jgi:hypothetical protein
VQQSKSSGCSVAWIYRYQNRGMGLGALNLVSLAEARPRRHASSAGIDPVTAKKAARAAISFDECAEQFIAPRGQGWKNRKHREQWHVRLRT